MVACFKWWISIYKPKEMTLEQIEPLRNKLLDAAVLVIRQSGMVDKKLVRLNTIRAFLDPTTTTGKHIPIEGPLPPQLLPISLSEKLELPRLKDRFGWRELTLLEWLQHVLSSSAWGSDLTYNITTSPQWAERTLTIVAECWTSLAENVQREMAKVLSAVVCIPTNMGMRLPREAYFKNVNVFSDLPLAKMPSGTEIRGPLEKVLEAIGVMKHVEVQTVFNR